MKKNNMYNNNLYTFFCTNNTSNIKTILEIFNEIDVLYENGIFFEFALSKGNNVDVCKALLSYFENKQFPEKNREYEEAKGKLIEILENITSDMDISSEMQKVLSPYIDFEDSVDIAKLSDLDEFDFTMPTSFYGADQNQEEDIKPLGDIVKYDTEIIS